LAVIFGLGTKEPAYLDPDAELVAAARKIRAEVAPARLRALVESLPGPRNRLHAPDAMAEADALISDAWLAAGWSVARQELDLHGVWGVRGRPGGDGPGKRTARYARLRGANLIATRAGRETDAIVVVAHHDTVRDSPGADDNGAGIAILIEAARLLARRQLRRTVVLAAPDFEEIGLIGSLELVRWLRARHRVRAAIVFDSIGYMDARPGTQRVPRGIGLLYPAQVARLRARDLAGDGVVAIHRRRSTGLVRVWAECAAALVGRERIFMLRDPADLPIVGPLLALALPVARDFSRSDHRRFWDAGLPAIHVTNTAEFRNPNYHLPSDLPATLDYETLADVTAATVLAVERLAGEPPPAAGAGRVGWSTAGPSHGWRSSSGPEDGGQEGVACIGAGPAAAQLFLAEPAADVSQDEHRDDDVVERPEDGDELRDDVDRAHQPGQQEHERQPDAERRLAVSYE
jgi:hypothetical protein